MNDNNQPRWQVSSQQETTRPGVNNQFVRGVNVTYTMANGTTGSVFVPMNQYRPDLVRREIEAAVTAHEQVSGLTG